jgi:hypothetical protein
MGERIDRCREKGDRLLPKYNPALCDGNSGLTPVRRPDSELRPAKQNLAFVKCIEKRIGTARYVAPVNFLRRVNSHRPTIDYLT